MEECFDPQRKEFCKGSFPEGLNCEVLQTIPQLLSGALCSSQCFATSTAMLFVCLVGFTAQPISINCCPAAHTGGKLAETKMPLLILFRKEFKILETRE